MAKQERGNKYLMGRLEKEHPAIFADWKAGKYRSPRQALEAAGLRKPTRSLNLLKNAWSKADAKERADFLAWIGSPATSSGSATIVDADRRLLHSVTARIDEIMDRRSLKMGDVMREMGINSRDGSLGGAMAMRPSRLRPELVKKVEKWLHDNRNV